MLRYHQVQPQNLKSTYGEYDSVDFELTFENRQLVPSSIKLEADLTVMPDGSALQTNQKVYIDPFIGAHSFVDSIITEVQSGGVLENFQNYPRFQRMVADTTMTVDDMMNSENTCELRSPNLKVTQALLSGHKMSNSTTTVLPPDFSIKPNFCLNTINAPLDYSKTGAVRITVKLARNFSALYGPGVAATTIYQLSNLRLCFNSVVGKPSKVSMRTKLGIKQAITSAFANIATKVPAVCRGVSCSFQLQSEENSQYENNVETVVPPNIKELSFAFNDSLNEYITYVIKGRAELLDKYIESFANTGSNMIRLSKLEARKGYGIGLQFGTTGDPLFIDLSNQKFNVQITSDISENYNIYMYFHSVASM